MTNEKVHFWDTSQSDHFAVLCVLWMLPSELNLRVSLGNRLGLYLGLQVSPWPVGVKDKPPFSG